MSTQSGNLRALCAHVDHRAGCGKCEICLAADQVEQLEIKNAELEKQVEMLLKLVERISQQTPEKPDYWSSCSQCEHNISDAEDAIASVKGGAA